MRLLVCIAGLFFAQLAAASPWLRPEGSHFLSFSVEISPSDGALFGSAYYEFGMREQTTLGFDFGTTDRDLYEAILFAKLFFRQLDDPFKAAFQIGIGLTDNEIVLRPGFSLGRGYILHDKSGWISVDTLAPISVSDGSFQMKTDVTFGLDFSSRYTLLLQFQTGYELDKVEYINLTPSLVVDQRSGRRLEFGVSTDLKDTNEFSLKLGLWNDF